MRSRDLCLAYWCHHRATVLYLCRRHYKRFYATWRLSTPTRSELFWSKVIQSGDCWLWTGTKSGPNGGYGLFKREGRRSFQSAHRVAYEEMVGEIPPGLFLDHLCRTPACVNPSHLDPVTNAVNCRRGLRGELTTHCPQGHAYDEANTKYTREGHRRCITCKRAEGRRYQRNRKTRTDAEDLRYLSRRLDHFDATARGIGMETTADKVRMDWGHS